MSVFLQILEGLLAGIAAGFVYELGYRIAARRLKRKPVFRIGELRIHHSALGIIVIAIGLWLRHYFLISMGIGIIIQHIMVERRLTLIDRS